MTPEENMQIDRSSSAGHRLWWRTQKEGWRRGKDDRENGLGKLLDA